MEPHIYLIGRNEAEASKIISEFRHINNQATVKFIKSDVSLLKNVDRTCEEITKQEPKVNLLFLSAGLLTTKGRTGEYNFRKSSLEVLISHPDKT